MLIEQAKVTDYQQGIVTVQCFAKRGCGGCVGQNHCGTKSLSALAGEKTAPQFTLKVETDVAVGDLIEIGLSERSLLLSVFWLYALPLLTLIGTTLLLSLWIENELVVALGILLSTTSIFIFIKKVILRKPMEQFTPVFLRKL